MSFHNYAFFPLSVSLSSLSLSQSVTAPDQQISHCMHLFSTYTETHTWTEKKNNSSVGSCVKVLSISKSLALVSASLIMASRSAFLLFFFILSLAAERSLASSVFSSRLIHRFSDEGRASIKPPEPFPEKRSFEYYRFLASIDSRRQRMNLGAKSQSLVPSEGSKTISTGNDFGW